jgi:hypothetical protein
MNAKGRRTLKKYMKKYGAPISKRNKIGLPPGFQHTLENCVCGAVKHNLGKFKAWQNIQNKMIEREKKRVNKIKISEKMQKEYGVSATDKVGGEYKDRHKQFGKK